MVNHTRILVEKILLLSVSVFFVLLSSFCWSRIIFDNYSNTSSIANGELALEGGKVSRLKENALVFTGVLMIIARHLPFEDDK